MKILIEATPKEIDKIVSQMLGRLGRYYALTHFNPRKTPVVKTETAGDKKADEPTLGYSFTWLADDAGDSDDETIRECKEFFEKEQKKIDDREN